MELFGIQNNCIQVAKDLVNGGMSAMILTKKKILFFNFFIYTYTSCETLEELAGLNKVDIDDSLYEGTPDLILPPDFNKTHQL